MEVVVTTGAVRRAKLQSNRHQQQTNIQQFCRPDALASCRTTQQCQSTEGKTRNMSIKQTAAKYSQRYNTIHSREKRLYNMSATQYNRENLQ